MPDFIEFQFLCVFFVQRAIFQKFHLCHHRTMFMDFAMFQNPTFRFVSLFSRNQLLYSCRLFAATQTHLLLLSAGATPSPETIDWRLLNVTLLVCRFFCLILKVLWKIFFFLHFIYIIDCCMFFCFNFCLFFPSLNFFCHSCFSKLVHCVQYSLVYSDITVKITLLLVLFLFIHDIL